MGGVLDVFEKLTLGSSGITEKQNIDVAAKAMCSLHELLLPAEHSERKEHLDGVVAVD